MLVVKILIHLGDTNGGIAIVQVGYMIPAAKEPVGAIHHHDLQVVYITLTRLLYITGQLPGLPVVFHSQLPDGLSLFVQLVGGQSFAKDTHLCVIDDIGLAAVVAADDVIVQYGLDVPIGCLCLLCHIARAQQSLFFTADRDKNNGGRK